MNIILYILSISASQGRVFDIILSQRLKSRVLNVIAELIFDVCRMVIGFWWPKLQIPIQFNNIPKLSIL